jgi:hypothetical protein
VVFVGLVRYADVTLLGLVDLTIVALLVFVHCTQRVNKAATAIAWGTATAALTFGFV